MPFFAVSKRRNHRHHSTLPFGIPHYHHGTITSSHFESKHVGPREGRLVCPSSSGGRRRQFLRPVRPSVRQSVVHRPSGFGAAAVEGDEVTHSNAKARPSASVVCLGRTDRRSRPLGRSVGGKWWKFDVWRTSTRDDRSIADLGRIRGNSLTLRRRWSDALMQIGFGSLALRQNNSIGSTWVKRLQPLVAAGAYAQQSGVQYWSGIPVLVGTATFREYEGKKVKALIWFCAGGRAERGPSSTGTVREKIVRRFPRPRVTRRYASCEPVAAAS